MALLCCYLQQDSSTGLSYRRVRSHAGASNLKFVGKLVLGIVLPVSLLAIVLAATFAYLFVKYKRRYAVILLSDLSVQKLQVKAALLSGNMEQARACTCTGLCCFVMQRVVCGCVLDVVYHDNCMPASRRPSTRD